MEKMPLLSQQVVDAITEMIAVEHRFLPGDKLPNELDLAQELGVSRITLREAIRVLCTRGVLEIQRGRGTFVLSASAARLAGKRQSALDFSGAGTKDLLELRRGVEPLVFALAAKRAEEDELLKIHDLFLKMEELSNRGQPFHREARDFLTSAAAASHNTLLRQLSESISAQAYREDERLSPHTLKGFRDVLHYLQTRNGEGARAAAEAYLFRLSQEAGAEVE